MAIMNQIRTTISFDEDLHKQLSLSAISIGTTLSDLINRRLTNKNFGQNTTQIQKSLASDLDFFATLGDKMGKTNWVKLVREERNRDQK